MCLHASIQGGHGSLAPPGYIRGCPISAFVSHTVFHCLHLSWADLPDDAPCCCLLQVTTDVLRRSESFEQSCLSGLTYWLESAAESKFIVSAAEQQDFWTIYQVSEMSFSRMIHVSRNWTLQYSYLCLPRMLLAAVCEGSQELLTIGHGRNCWQVQPSRYSCFDKS